jgi:uncharacterized protein YbjT (DUF2867 family)
MEKRIALVFGSTGLIGNLLVEELVQSGLYKTVKTFVRQPTGVTEPLVEEYVTDFSDTGKLAPEFAGDDVYICLGTTIRKAGSVANMERIDRDLPLKIAELAFAAGIKRIAVVSSIGAASKSGNYYLRIKGEMEEGILKTGFQHAAIVRPSILLGERKERRAGEIVGKVVMKTVSPLLAGSLRKYRAIHGGDVARAMITILQGEPVKKVFESDELQILADKYINPH